MTITVGRALKIWWSYSWRSWLLMLLAFVLLVPLSYWLVAMPMDPASLAAMDPQMMPDFIIKFTAVWLFGGALMILTQALAFRWLLRTSWSDFRLIAVSPAGIVDKALSIETPGRAPEGIPTNAP